ncbi:DRC1 protein, partial [Grantiella picta]|nr:DRC1 protein [Grantiella picta]
LASRRLEKLEREAKHGMEKLQEINSKWSLAKEMKIPQELWELLEQQQDQCEKLLADKNQLIQELQQELKSKDEQYEEALKEQGNEIHLLLERMEEQTRHMLKTYRHNLRQIEKTFEEERREMLDNNRKRWNETIRSHNDLELEFLQEQMEKAGEFEKQLIELQDENTENYDTMRFQLEKDVQYLEKRLRQMKGIYHLNQVKLEYNLEVLRELHMENSTLRSFQKRKISRLQSVLSLLKVKMAKQEQKFQEEKQSLESECERIAGQLQETRGRMRYVARCNSEKFRKVWIVNEEEAKGLVREVLDADRIIHVQQLGMPWEEPDLWFMDNVGPLGGRREKKDAMQVAMEVLEGGGEGGKEDLEKVEERATSHPNISRETLRKILELLSEESGFLVENKLLRPLQEVVAPSKTVWKLQSIFETFRIEDEDELRELLDFFVEHITQETTDSQVGSPGDPRIPGKRSQEFQELLFSLQDTPGGEDPTDPAQDQGNGRSHSQTDELRSPGSSNPAVPIQVDEILKILKEFLRGFDKLRWEWGRIGEVLDVRDNSKDGEYWEALSSIIPKRTLKLWDALGAALLEY